MILTWDCMICGDERPDDKIDVIYRPMPGLEQQFPETRINVRHCGDRPACIEAARTYTWGDKRMTETPVARRSPRRIIPLGIGALLGYIAVIVLANWALHHLGAAPKFPNAPHTLPVWPGMDAPSGVWFVAVALVLRNVLQRHLGRLAAIAAICVGAGISWFVADPTLAKASFWAFLCSEALDMAVYTPLRAWLEGRGWAPVQVAVSVLPAALAGAAVDSALFLKLAFHGESFFVAQMIGKTWGVLGATLVLMSVPVVTSWSRRTPEVVPA